MLAVAGGCSTLLIMGLIGFFLVYKAIDPLREAGWHFLTTFEWIPDGIPDQTGPLFGVGAMVVGTLISATLAVIIAVPISVGAALFISHYAPRKMRGPLTTLIDLMAAIPSLIFGLWGLYYLQPRMNGITHWMADYLGFIPIFKTTVPFYGNSLFVVGVVLALMIIPIITSVSRAVMDQVPRAQLRSRARARGHAMGDGAPRHPSAQPKRHHRRVDARSRARGRRDDRGRVDLEPFVRRVAAHPAAGGRLDRRAHRELLR